MVTGKSLSGKEKGECDGWLENRQINSNGDFRFKKVLVEMLVEIMVDFSTF